MLGIAIFMRTHGLKKSNFLNPWGAQWDFHPVQSCSPAHLCQKGSWKQFMGRRQMHAQGSLPPFQECVLHDHGKSAVWCFILRQGLDPQHPSTSITHRVGAWDDPDAGATPEHKLCVAIQDPLLPENLSMAQVWDKLCMEETCCHLWQTGPRVRVCHREKGQRKGFSRILFLDSRPAIKKGLCFSLSRASTPTSCMHPPTACVLCFYYGCSLR